MALNNETPLQDQPAYRAAEAARILGLPAATVKAWCFGHDYVHPDGTPARFLKLIEAADSKHKLLSFANLCELHVLAALRRTHRIAMPKVRDSLHYVGQKLGQQQPLIAQTFLTNGIDLFIEHADRLVSVSAQGQQAMRGDFQQALARIERNSRGTPVRLFPFSRRSAELSGQPAAVAIDPSLAFGRPTLLRAGVTTDVIEDRFRAGDSPQEMADDYRVDQSDILEALRFELETRRAA